jgi:hypothetical protein
MEMNNPFAATQTSELGDKQPLSSDANQPQAATLARDSCFSGFMNPFLKSGNQSLICPPV